MFLVIILTAYYFYFFWFEHSFNICIGQPKCSTGRDETTAWLGIFLRPHLVVFLTFPGWGGEWLGVRALILSQLLSSPLRLSSRAAHAVIPKLLEGKRPSQRQFRLEGMTPGMKCHSQASQNIFFSFLFPGACLWLIHSLAPTWYPPYPLFEGENVASCVDCSCRGLSV